MRTKFQNKLGYQIGFVGLGLSLLLVGCTLFQASQPSDSVAVAEASTALGQMLPITAQIQIEGQPISLEVARTAREQEIGLMNRTSLAANRGMLFIFEPARPTQFWMKNTLINLDMVFLHQGVVKYIANDVPPCQAAPCPTYGPRMGNIDQVIELAGGRAAELKLKVGDRIPVEFFSVNEAQRN
ncbi:DUF192 domain-containing protein [Myxacorys almedinensis]|nr:DUF192 domain-containing protein [Myxacorys almedinensis]